MAEQARAGTRPASGATLAAMVVRTVVAEGYGALMTCEPEHFDYHGDWSWLRPTTTRPSLSTLRVGRPRHRGLYPATPATPEKHPRTRLCVWCAR